MVGCAPVVPKDPVRPITPAHVTRVAPASDVAPSLPSAGEVTATFFGADGTSWGPWGEPTSDTANAVTPCYGQALGQSASLKGWLRVRIPGRAEGGYGAATLLDSSPLPGPLVSCVLAGLRGLQAPEGLDGPPRVAYLTFR
jgi:hypothetical protein